MRVVLQRALSKLRMHYAWKTWPQAIFTHGFCSSAQPVARSELEQIVQEPSISD